MVGERPELGGGAATPSFALPDGAGPGLPGAPRPLVIGPRSFAWGSRTYVMGILNVTPDSFSGDGLLAAPRARSAAALGLARRMAAAGADILDVGGESSRPGTTAVGADEEIARVVPVIRAIRAALPGMPRLRGHDQAGRRRGRPRRGRPPRERRLGGRRGRRPRPPRRRARRPDRPHAQPRRGALHDLLPEIVGDLQRAIERALGPAWPGTTSSWIPGSGSGRRPSTTWRSCGSRRLAILGRPILLGTSRKSTLGRVLDLPADQRLEATLATTALAIASGVDIVRVHDVRENVARARMADLRSPGRWPPEGA